MAPTPTLAAPPAARTHPADPPVGFPTLPDALRTFLPAWLEVEAGTRSRMALRPMLHPTARWILRLPRTHPPAWWHITNLHVQVRPRTAHAVAILTNPTTGTTRALAVEATHDTSQWTITDARTPADTRNGPAPYLTDADLTLS